MLCCVEDCVRYVVLGLSPAPLVDGDDRYKDEEGFCFCFWIQGKGE